MNEDRRPNLHSVMCHAQWSELHFLMLL